MLSCFLIKVDYDNIYMVSSLILWMLIDYFVYRHESVIEELSDIEIVPLEQNEVDVSGMAAEVQRLFEEDRIYRNYSAPPMGMSNRLTVVLQQELH